MGERSERATRLTAIAAGVVFALGVATAAGGWADDDADGEAQVKGVQLTRPDGETSTTSTTRATTSTTEAPPSSTTTTAAAATTTTTATTAAPRPTSSAPTAPPRPVCLDSTDPACGAFGWASTPAPNDPLALTLTRKPNRAVVGEPVTFTIVASDPDAPVRSTQIIRFGDGEEIGTTKVDRCADRYGPWTLPPETAGSTENVVRHVYAKAGTYTIEVVVESGEDCAPNLHPYANQATMTMKFEVNG